jgi:hypothetical protein
VHIHGEAGAIGRLDKESTEPIACITTNTRRSNEAARAAFSGQASGASGTIGARASARACVTAGSDCTCRAHFAIKSREASGPGEAAWNISAHRIQGSSIFGEPFWIDQIKECQRIPGHSHFLVDSTR